jgi:predicted PurR-regulated permease PerM
MEEKKASTSEPVKRSVNWYFHPFFQYAFGILLVLLIILVFYHVAIFLHPFFDFVSILFAPIVISLLFYYLLRPIVNFFEGYKVPRVVTITGIYLLLALAIILFVAYIGPILVKQVTALANVSAEAWEKVTESSESTFLRFFKIHFDNEVKQRLFNVAQQVTTTLSKSLLDFIAFLTRVATILAVIPFIVFYLLKDDQSFISFFLSRAPEDYGLEIRKILRNMDETLSNYITGLALVSFIVGTLLFIGYLIIGLNYALILSLIAIVLITIPFLGPFLAITPAILVGLSTSSLMVLKVIIVFVIVEQIEANIISPQIIGQRLNIHPLTIILLLLAAGSLYGLVGLFLVTPLYALLKVLIQNLYKIYHWHYVYSKKHLS